jgi:hypothetical protein
MHGASDANGMPGVGSKLLWKHPDPESTPMHRYLKAVNYAHGLQLSSYPELHQWSIANIDAFWQSVWKFVGVRAEGEASPVSRKPSRELTHVGMLTTTTGRRFRGAHVSSSLLLQACAPELC